MIRCSLLTITALLAGCTYIITPQTEVYYDEGCQIEFKQMTLTAHQVDLIPVGAHCSGEADCGAQLAAFLAITPVSAVVSGSIVVVGNTAYWLQKTGRCLAKT